MGAGGAFARKMKKDASVHMAFFGDSALEEGVAFEALNIAALWKLPCVFLCENNSAEAWAPGSGGYTTLVHAAHDLRAIPAALGIPTTRVDGVDVEACHAAIAEGVARCRAGEGPVFIEAMTKRWAGSAPLWPELSTGVTDLRMATGDAPTTGEHQAWYEHDDPVLRLARALIAAAPANEKRVFEIDARVRARMAAAEAFAIASPPPATSSLLEHVFA